MVIFEVKVGWEDKIERIEKTRLNRLRRQDWRTSSSILSILSIFFNLHQSEKYNKLRNNKLKNINI